MPETLRLRLSRDAVRKLFRSKRASVSEGLVEVLERYSEKVDDDVLKEFLEERR